MPEYDNTTCDYNTIEGFFTHLQKEQEVMKYIKGRSNPKFYIIINDARYLIGQVKDIKKLLLGHFNPQEVNYILTKAFKLYEETFVCNKTMKLEVI